VKAKPIVVAIARGVDSVGGLEILGCRIGIEFVDIDLGHRQGGSVSSNFVSPIFSNWNSSVFRNLIFTIKERDR
jgi:hypothetical protein